MIEKNNNPKSVSFLIKKNKPKPSIVYNTYWEFISKRQDIFFKRINNVEFPWSNDDILNNYKFTNVYRATDRVSQYLIRDIIYKGSQEPDELFFRIVLFKIFNRISTWEFIKDELGEISFKNYSFKAYDELLLEVLKSKEAIYSPAYIMASGKSAFGKERKHQNHLLLIEKMINDKLPHGLQQCKSMKGIYELLLSYPTIGEFLAYQYTIDLNYSNLTNFSEMEFVKAGPGAKDGITKCFTSLGDYNYEDIIKMMADNQHKEFERLGIKFQNLGGRSLQLIDCQNVFCEVDKYSRLFHPEIAGVSNRTRIKQKFKIEKKEQINYFFPPKWNINKLI
ncbi:putative DNA base hypermodification protein [Flavobacterium sp. TR2]|uniref:nucleotide kinase domain-containing protein n=1 Tax=Flavobacterium sp. TR2 TaxID=2977321 RepID=UPI0021B0907F|nr:nucleotide kinase domain-containing protein [Flavobacterium sp. TR2]UWY26997.1 putative DNA base hypermodification protein [Flavobacterium sp. TR2]